MSRMLIALTLIPFLVPDATHGEGSAAKIIYEQAGLKGGLVVELGIAGSPIHVRLGKPRLRDVTGTRD